jgi:hypothetical protein
MVHVPTATSVAVLPETVHTGVVSEAKLTGRPEDAVAARVRGALPSAIFESDAKVMVWLVGDGCVTWKLWLTGAAAA